MISAARARVLLSRFFKQRPGDCRRARYTRRSIMPGDIGDGKYARTVVSDDAHKVITAIGDPRALDTESRARGSPPFRRACC